MIKGKVFRRFGIGNIILPLMILLGGGYVAGRAQDQTVTGSLTVTGGFKAGTTSTSSNFEFRSNGIIISRGTTSSSSLLSGDQGSGPRFLWYPQKGAFRAGNVSGTQWDESNIGTDSVAFTGARASGLSSFAVGINTAASGGTSIAMGDSNVASGMYSTAIGGSGNVASGFFSTAVGAGNIASGFFSLAAGAVAIANGSYTTAFGQGTLAHSVNSTTLGRYNVGGGHPTTWVETDPLLEVGNGTATNPSNAFTLYKNGDAEFMGVVSVAPGGDISMGEFTATP